MKRKIAVFLSLMSAMTIFMVAGQNSTIQPAESQELPTPTYDPNKFHASGFDFDDERDLSHEIYRRVAQDAAPGLIEVPVIQLNFFPRDPDNPNILDRAETGWGSPPPYYSRYGYYGLWTPLTIDQWRTTAHQMGQTMSRVISDATYYHGAAGNSPSPGKYLEYEIYEVFDYYEQIPYGVHMGDQISGDLTMNVNGQIVVHEGGGTRKDYRPHYRNILSDLPNGGICHYVDTLGIREVWMYGYHADMVVPEGDTISVIVPDESRMSSKHQDVSNDYPVEELLPDNLKMPLCDHSYVLYNFTYQPGGAIDNPVHNRMHQIENVVFYAENLGYPTGNAVIGNSVFWSDFSVIHREFELENYRASCGNTHFPPNAKSSNLEYRYDWSGSGENNCETWNIDDSQTTYRTQNCQIWGCYAGGFYVWYMQNMPGWQNEIVNDDGCQMRNWWELMADFDLFIDKGHTLWSCPDNPIETLEETLGLVTNTPTATPVTPTATPVTPTATPVTPTATPVTPTATPVTPTATPVTPTATPVTPTATPVTPTATPVTPTATPVTPTATPVTPTATPVTPTATPVTPTATPATLTATPATPKATPATLTATPATPKATPVTPTATPVTLTVTPVTPTVTPEIVGTELPTGQENDERFYLPFIVAAE